MKEHAARNGQGSATLRAHTTWILIYLSALFVGVTTARMLWPLLQNWFAASLVPVAAGLLGTVVATVIVWIASSVFGNSSLYDPYWSVQPPILALAYYFCAGGQLMNELRFVLALVLVLVWSFRLTSNWARGWGGLSHEDWRYRKLRADTGGWFPVVNLLGIHLFPTLQVFLGSLPLYVVVQSRTPLGIPDAVAVLLGLLAVSVEEMADRQLHRFRRSTGGTGSVCRRGLWACCRHPNYLGEIGFWVALYVFGLAADPSWWPVGLGAVSITLMFIFLSIPMLESRQMKRRPEYRQYVAEVPMLLPLPQRRSSTFR